MFKALAFLGNPGKVHRKQRHNTGFLFSQISLFPQNDSWSKKFKGEFSTLLFSGRRVHLLRPLTYMNESGQSIRKLMDFYRLSPEDFLIIHDDLEMDLGMVKIQRSGGLGGHNGLRSIEKHFGSRDFYRLKFGIGRPHHGKVHSWVLGNFTPEEFILLEGAFDEARTLLEDNLRHG
jgi:PTH1 family peptidyl-tRNA hydrolase